MEEALVHQRNGLVVEHLTYADGAFPVAVGSLDDDDVDAIFCEGGRTCSLICVRRRRSVITWHVLQLHNVRLRYERAGRKFLVRVGGLDLDLLWL